MTWNAESRKKWVHNYYLARKANPEVMARRKQTTDLWRERKKAESPDWYAEVLRKNRERYRSLTPEEKARRKESNKKWRENWKRTTDYKKYEREKARKYRAWKSKSPEYRKKRIEEQKGYMNRLKRDPARYNTHAEKALARSRAWLEKPENREMMKMWVANSDRKRIKETREKILELYGHSCACCGETEPIFLTLDHINNDGAKERKMGPRTSYAQAIKSYDPTRYQILCYNCNMGRARNKGICPHKQKTSAIDAMTKPAKVPEVTVSSMSSGKG